MEGYKLLGGGAKEARAEHDYYATSPKAVELLLKNYELKGDTFLEPCVGAGHIANTIEHFYNGQKKIIGIDIVDRGYPDTILCDFLKWEPDSNIDCIVTNPPYSLALEFTEKCLDILGRGGAVVRIFQNTVS